MMAHVSSLPGRLPTRTCAPTTARRPRSSRSASTSPRPSSAGVPNHLPTSQITFDKFYVIAHASRVIDQMRRIEQKLNPNLKGKRWVLLNGRTALTLALSTVVDGKLEEMTTTRTARVWQYPKELRDILTPKQPNVERLLLNRWCSNILRSKVEPMKKVAEMVRNHLEAILAWGHLAADLRVPRGNQWTLPGCEAQSSWVQTLPHHLHGHLHDRRQALLLAYQPLRHRIADSFFNGARRDD